MSQLTEFNQNNLLFKRFQGQIQTLIIPPNNYAGESGAKSLSNVFNDTIFSSDVSSNIAQNFTVFNLDAGPINSGNPNVPNVPDTSANSFSTGIYGFIDISNTTNLRFYKRIFLTSVSSTPFAWWLIDPSSADPTTTNNLLKDMIPFAYNDLDLAMFTPIVYYYTGPVPPGLGDEDNPNYWTSVEQQQPPLYWLVDYESGVLQLYAQLDGSGKISGTEIVTPSTYPPQAYQVPRISFIKYTGDKGAAPIGGGGGSDISGIDISNIQINLEKLNRMILPDGYVDISGTNYDLCGNEVVRTYYTYNRKNMYIGYENLPILDGSAVDHSEDPSHNDPNGIGQRYELDISGSIYFSNKIMQGFSFAGAPYSSAFGTNNRALSSNSFVIGLDNSANGNRSFASGTQTTAIGTSSHTEGFLTKAHANYSHARGEGTIIDCSAGSSIGKYNDISQNVLFIVGNGSSDSNRKDAFAIDLAGNTLLFCNNIIDTSNIYFCNNTALLGQSSNILTISGDLDMSMNQIINIADATDNSGVPSWGQVQQAIIDGSGGTAHWLLNGTSIYYNLGHVGIGTLNPSTKLEVSGNITCDNLLVDGIVSSTTTDLTLATNTTSIPQITCKAGSIAQVGIGNSNPQKTLDVNGDSNLSQNAFVSQSQNQSQITVDKNLYTRNTNLIDTLKIDFKIFFGNIWIPMIEANLNGIYQSQSTGQIYKLSQANPGKPTLVNFGLPTFSSAWGPSVIPIAYLDINQNYLLTPFEPVPGLSQNNERPYIANTCAYFTIKFAQPYDNNNTNNVIDWQRASYYYNLNPPPTGTFKAGYGAITHQTITFIAGYTENFNRFPGDDTRKPKPFIKVLSTNIPNLKNLTGITTPDGITAIDLVAATSELTSYGSSNTTPKIGGLVRIIIAESCPGLPADKEIQNKAWLFIEQQWNVEPWQINQGINNSKFIQSLVGDHIIDVRMYANNLGDLNQSRSPPFTNNFNTDWQLVTETDLLTTQKFSWEKFVLPMGNYARPPIFSTPTIVPPTDVSFTLMVGGTPCPNPLTGDILNSPYPPIYPGLNPGTDLGASANQWEVWLNLRDWPYGITTTEEIFENNVEMYLNLDVSGNLSVGGIIGPDITCNNLDALNSIDVGPNQNLTFIENSIVSTVTATSWAPNPGGSGSFNPGLEFEAENFYFDCTSQNTTRGFIISLAKPSSDSIFRIVDNNNNYQTNIGLPPLFQIEGGGLATTQSLHPWIDMCYNIGISSGTFNRRYKTLYVGNIDTSGNVDISGNLTVDGIIGPDITCNNLNVLGDTVVTDLSATNIDVSNDLNVEGLITGVAETTFVEYRDYTGDIAGTSAGWYCIARTKDTNPTGGADNARGLFIIDDNTSGRRQQIIFYAGTAYSRGNYINVIANNWYGPTPTITNLKLETGGIYEGTNLYVYRQSTTVADRVYVRLYENTRVSNTGGQWELTATPIAGLTNSPVELDLTYNPNNDRTNAVSSLDTLLYGDFIVKPPNNDSNNVIDVDREAIRVNFGGYDYTSGSNIIGNPNPINRVIIDLQAGKDHHQFNIADSGSVIQTLGGIKILPLQSNSNGVPPNYAAPGWGASLFLGEWGWGNQTFNSQKRLSQRTFGLNNPGSGNVYCNAIRQNIVFSKLNTQGPIWTAGYQGNGTITGSSMYYNQGDIRYIIIDPTNGSNRYATVTLPTISEPMLGQAITVSRTNVPSIFANYQAAVFVRANTPDRINCPNSIFVHDNNQGGIAIDPYNLIGNSGAGFPGFNIPNPYKGNEICSITLVASQNGYYNTLLNGTSGGGAISTQYVWQFISSGGPGV